MNTSVRCGAVVVLLMLSAACGSSEPALPSGTQPWVDETPPPPTYLPPLSGPSRTFTFATQLAYSVRSYTEQSRFVLYDNGSFVLRYDGLGFEYRGVYSVLNGVMTFDFGAGSWGATGGVRGDSLTVRYNEWMEHSDFENAVYTLMR